MNEAVTLKPANILALGETLSLQVHSTYLCNVLAHRDLDNITQKVLMGITKTYLYNFDPLKLHFYIIKLGFTGVYIIFLISAQKHRLWVLVRTALSRRF